MKTTPSNKGSSMSSHETKRIATRWSRVSRFVGSALMLFTLSGCAPSTSGLAASICSFDNLEALIGPDVATEEVALKYFEMRDKAEEIKDNASSTAAEKQLADAVDEWFWTYGKAMEEGRDFLSMGSEWGDAGIKVNSLCGEFRDE